MTLRSLIVAVALASGTSVAAAEPAPRSQAVSYAGFDLSSPAGASRLQSRLHAAVQNVCAENGVRDLAAQARVSRCMREAKERNAVALAAAVTKQKAVALAAR